MALGRVLEQDRVGVVDVDERLARSLQSRKRLERPARARQRDVSHVARASLRDAEPGELVVAPEGPVDEYQIARGEPAEHAIVQTGETGNVGDDAATYGVTEDETARLEFDV